MPYSTGHITTQSNISSFQILSVTVLFVVSTEYLSCVQLENTDINDILGFL